MDPAAVLQAFPGVTCSLARVLQPQDSPVEEEGQILPSEENGSYQNFITTMICGERRLCVMMEVAATSPLRVRQLHMDVTLTKKEKNVLRQVRKKNLDEIVEIAFITKGQAAVQRFVIYFFFLLK